MNATAWAGELGPIKQNQVSVEEANHAYGIAHHSRRSPMELLAGLGNVLWVTLGSRSPWFGWPWQVV
jgi:hypothetical protein